MYFISFCCAVSIISLRNFISVAWILSNSFFVHVQGPDAFVNIGLKYVLYIAILLLMGTSVFLINYLECVSLPCPISFVKRRIITHVTHQWNEHWINSAKESTTRNLFFRQFIPVLVLNICFIISY